MQELVLLMEGGCVDARDQEFVRLVKQAKAGDMAAFETILSL